MQSGLQPPPADAEPPWASTGLGCSAEMQETGEADRCSVLLGRRIEHTTPTGKGIDAQKLGDQHLSALVNSWFMIEGVTCPTNG